MVHKCKRCGECCKLSPKLTNEDIRRIESLGAEKSFFVEIINGLSYMRTQNDQCVFLKKENGTHGCMIYDQRPAICRAYPSIDTENCTPEKFSFDDYLKRKNGHY